MKRILIFLFALIAAAAWAQPKVAVLDAQIPQNMDPSVIIPATDKIVEKLVQSGNFTVLDRANIESVLKERELQVSGMTDQDAVAAGKYLNADFIVVAKVSRVGNTNFVSGKMINVGTGAIQSSQSAQGDGKLSMIIDLAGQVGDKLAGGSGEADNGNVVVAAPPAAEPAPAFAPEPAPVQPETAARSYQPSSARGIARNFLGIGLLFSSDKWSEKDESGSYHYTETDTYNLATLQLTAVTGKFLQFGLGLTWYNSGNSEWENTSKSLSGSDSDPSWYGISLKDCTLSWVDLSMLLRLPISVGSSFALVPLLGIEYDINTSFEYNGTDVKQYLSDEGKAALNHFFFQLGLGMQIDAGPLVIYPEFLYGFKLNSQLDDDVETDAKANGWSSSSVSEGRLDIGCVVGFKLN